MPVGKIKWFDVKKGYGFIVTNEGTDVFVHFSSIDSDQQNALDKGVKVEFELIDDQKGQRASKVKIIN